jgi:Domain of unknown function (DUF4421)
LFFLLYLRFRMKSIGQYTLVFLFLISPFFLHGQGRTKEERQAHHDSMMVFWNRQDTNFVRKYPDRFIVTLSQSYRQYDVRFLQTLIQDTMGIGAPRMIADGNAVTGISIDFDKISFSFGIRSVPPTTDVEKQKGKTKYQSYNFSFGFYRFRFESSYRHYHGFYDLKTPSYDTSFARTGIYYQNPSMDVRSIRVKTLFIFKKRKFSYNSAYFNTQRQLKTKGSFLLVSNIYDYRIKADTSLIPFPSRIYYEKYADLNYFRAQGISIGPGFSWNLVILKTLYLNLTLTSAFDFQRRIYDTYSKNYQDKFWKVGTAGDFRAALGMNGKRMFASVTYRLDVNSYLSDGIRIEPRFNAVDLNIGYRFPFKERAWVKKMKENKWYQLI